VDNIFARQPFFLAGSQDLLHEGSLPDFIFGWYTELERRRNRFLSLGLLVSTAGTGIKTVTDLWGCLKSTQFFAASIPAVSASSNLENSSGEVVNR
jgi:hypothetical protein